MDALALLRGAAVRYRPLKGCEARIFGNGDAAVITVNAGSPLRRRRFSLAHELGHWEHHRGKLLFCQVADMVGDKAKSPAERVANGYAADLLMPRFMLDPLVAELSKFDFAAVDKLAELFRVSRTAMAMRIVDRSPVPLLLVCHGPSGRKWFHRSQGADDRWFPRDTLDTRSSAFELQFGRAKEAEIARKVSGGAWFDRREADGYTIAEHCVRGGNGTTITLLHLTNRAMAAS